MTRVILLFIGVAALVVGGHPRSAVGQKPRVVILVVDGLRPDYVTERFMPRLNALADAGVRGLAHHAVFPTVTRVNGPSIFTGRYPSGHGVMGNSVYLPAVDSSTVFNTSSADDLREIDRATGGALLTAPSLGELLAARGFTFFAASSGSPGSGMLMNHRGSGAGLVHFALTIPDTLERIVNETVGPAPAVFPLRPAVARVAWAVDAVLDIGLDRADADVMAAWLTEPDGTAHRTGVGSPETIEVLGGVDAQIGRLLDGLERRGVLEHTDILVTSDHGFARRIGTESITDLLVEAGLKDSTRSHDVVVAGDAIHVNVGGDARRRAIVELLQRTDWIGPVFTQAGSPGSARGMYPGTVAFSAIGWNHQRSADILTSADWTDAVNDHGYAGAVLSQGIAGHGSASPWDIRATFLAAGPRIKRGVVSDVPTGNVDIVPTTLSLIGAALPNDLDGRVLTEVMADGPPPADVEIESDPIVAAADFDGLRYEVTANRVRVGRTVYFIGASVRRNR